MYYTQESSSKWHGADRSTGQNGKVIFVEKGSDYVYISQNIMVEINKKNMEVLLQMI